MASVYLAVDTRLQREVALKVMRPHLVHDESFIARFEREARSAAQLSHPNIVAVHDQGRDGERVFLVMEYVPGRTLRQVLDARGALTPRAALDFIEPVLDALAAAHRAGLIHRDIKPENVILRDDGMVKVADFGLARSVSSHTATSVDGMLMGTVSYLSPEQVERGIADARSDVYAAGLVLFEMLTGTKAFQGETAINIAYQHVHEGVPTLSSRLVGTPPALDDLVASATARDPDQRPADAGVFAEAVRELYEELPDSFLDHPPTASVGPSPERTGALPRPDLRDTARLPVTTQTVAVPPLAPGAPSSPGPDPSPRRRIWPWALVVLSAALFGTTVWFFFVGPGKSVTIPAVDGKPVAVAQKALEASGLTSRVRENFSEDVAKGIVIGSDPRQGASTWRSRPVTLLVSKGPERYAVPELAGLPLATALTTLTDGHLSAGTQSEDFSESVPAGSVIATDPAAGTPMKPGGPVALVVSKGRQPIEVTDFTGKPADEAANALQGAGLQVDASAHENSTTVAKGSVIRQSPASGTLFKGDKVTLVVSDGPPLVDVPNVVGKQVDAARTQLEAAGFKVSVESILGGIFGTVRLQSPAGGTQAPQGSTITLTTV